VVRQRYARYALISLSAGAIAAAVVLTSALGSQPASGADAARHAAVRAASVPTGNTLSTTTEVSAGRMTVWIRYRYQGKNGIVVRALRASFVARKSNDTPFFDFVFRHADSGKVDARLSSPRDNANHVKAYGTGWFRPRAGQLSLRAGGTVIVTLTAENATASLYPVMKVGLVLTKAVP
jgi:hypothetical protein